MVALRIKKIKNIERTSLDSFPEQGLESLRRFDRTF